MLDKGGWKIEYDLGTRSNFGLYVDLIWIGLHLILNWFDLIEFDLMLIGYDLNIDIDIEFDWIWCWYDIDWMRVWFDLIKTLWYCKQVNVRFELKSNVHDNAPMSKVEDVMQSWIRRRREWN